MDPRHFTLSWENEILKMQLNEKTEEVSKLKAELEEAKAKIVLRESEVNFLRDKVLEETLNRWRLGDVIEEQMSMEYLYQLEIDGLRQQLLEMQEYLDIHLLVSGSESQDGSNTGPSN